MIPSDVFLTPRGLRFAGRTFPCTIGRGGVTADKREGDGGTPAGAHGIVAMLYRPDRMAQPAAWARPIRPGDLWSDDPADTDYNRQVRAPHRFGHERLRRPDPLYDLVLVTDWNWRAPVPGRGSAIFIHRWRRPGRSTEGCVALRPDHLRWIAARLAPGSRLIV
ncbi:L,D-transpeptidase family protein [Roseitranquillus sediminis]|uniref:L,D-transpeptidase family protein n=1 Tax=Roseitranquillus sediminis TaxID=2809051 RepID=UPI001D0C6BB4|nr:L,D-transpeptidase family protein [Roseitranquillus sediminis]MBM9596274.1 L,D-transpeptidase family protein [Roseitranquillus sediminis]